jgi:heme A synthase
MFETWLLVGTLGLTGFLGIAAAYLALRAFRRVRDDSLLLTATGFGLITSATVLGAVGCVFLNVYDVTVHIAQSTAVAAGLFAIIYSISHVRGAAARLTEPLNVQQREDRRHHRTYSQQTISDK